MKNQFVFFGSLLNPVTLVLGVVLGFLAGTTYSGRVQAQNPQAPIEEVTPAITAGAAGFGTLLAGRFAADEIDSHGVDLLKFDQNLLTLLSNKSIFFSREELQKLAGDSLAPKILQLKIASAPAATPTPKKPGGK